MIVWSRVRSPEEHHLRRNVALAENESAGIEASFAARVQTDTTGVLVVVLSVQ